MATFVTLYNFTDQGLRNIKDTVKRAEAIKEAAGKAGVKIKETLWLDGQYDALVIGEASDDAAATAFALSILKAGNVRSQTMRGYTAAEMKPILDKVT